ncbi:beta-N-acetylglucosaminidase domain-containing protein [Streptomyces sp. NBC_00572]|uniref:beta-N-acetylglucosaminidase domain-containing protein n=1 Tax=Streptomyces sp. NBC_00572 TaxID=2903664 RepID=UPI0022588AC3|nr:beta-N-acetylglucosaminidase domain-containing protein [Streptomyces sp. NBC_00572]MCX4980934.1 beta-N-acetylglucosaminidase domain-containing protein [Streptomyces sp. NBC_00572]
MHLGHLGRRKRTATAVAAAVIGGLLGGAVPGSAQAVPKAGPLAPTAPRAPLAPGDPATPTGPATPTAPSPTASSSTTADAVTPRVPAVWPRPQSLTGSGPAVRLGDEVTLLADADADPYALAALRELLRAAGVRTVHTGLPGRGPLFRVAGPSGEAAEDALSALRVPDRIDLPRGGYRLATGRLQGRDTVVLDGVGEDGLFHAVQTLRQLLGTGREIPGVVVRDWPGTVERGITEGFYGTPWTAEQRLDQIDFLGRTKQNRYLYAPGDDPYRGAQWREPYPPAQQAEFRALAERARANHVTLGWAVAPAQSMCLSSAGDVAALTRKLDEMGELGVRSFQLQFQDASYDEWHCDRDADTFGRGPEAAAAAHARVANTVARHLAERHPDAEPLTVMPTEYYQDGTTAYRTAFARALDTDVRVAWTGVGVVPRTITGGELATARGALRHPLVTMDNYPVNDYAQDRLFLGPATGREPAVAAGSVAFLALAMEQPAASRVPLFTTADYAWNPRGYRPRESWQAAVDDLAGPEPAAREALRALAGNGASSILDPAGESAYLKPLLAAFWASRTSAGAGTGADARRDEAARALRAAFTVMREAPGRLSGTAGGTLDDETGPWLEQLSRYGRAGEAAVDMLVAQAAGDGAAAWRAQLRLEELRKELKGSLVTVGAGVLDPFLTRAVERAKAWTGADRTPAARPDRATDSYTVRLDRARPVEALTVMTEPGTGAVGDARVEAYVPGEGWRALGPLSASGWTQAELKGLRAEALRVVWSGGGPAPEVRSLVPWFADGPRAGLDLARTETDAEIGGPAQRVDVELSGLRAGEVRGPLTAKAPKGIAVALPKQAVVERGARTTVPLEVSVAPDAPAGTYRVPVSFAGEERVLTVRAFPRTAGPDLTRTATASSSGDETADFPASSAADGDPATRWSSPAEDGAWWQMELPEPARIGQVVLHWQDAYASRYRVQVSADGRVWRTAATVADGKGGRESVRMDAADTRFLRVQGETRATRYGYSLWSVETYAVAPKDPPKDAPEKPADEPTGEPTADPTQPGTDTPETGTPEERPAP